MYTLNNTLDPRILENNLKSYAQNNPEPKELEDTITLLNEYFEWAYNKDAVNFHTFQQLKDITDTYRRTHDVPTHSIHTVRPEKPNPILHTAQMYNFDANHTQPPQNTHALHRFKSFVSTYAIIVLPLLTFMLFGFIYVTSLIFTSDTSSTQLATLINTPRQPSSTNPQPLTPSTPNTDTTSISFQGVIKDISGIPIEDTTNVTFKLYPSPDAESTIYDTSVQNPCVVTPIIDGTVRVDIGKECGPPLQSSTIASYNKLWLGISTELQEEIQPRKELVFSQGGLIISTNPSTSEASKQTTSMLNGNSLDLFQQNSASSSAQGAYSNNLNQLTSLSTPPSSAQAGYLYFNADSEKVFVHDGASWQEVGGSLSALTVKNSYKDNAVVHIANTISENKSKGLEISLGFKNGGNSDNIFLSFTNGEGKMQGSIRSNGNGGVSYNTSGADFAEYFKRDLTTSYNKEDVEAGTLMCLGKQAGVVPCDTTSQYIVGALSNNPGFIGGQIPSSDNSQTNVTSSSKYALIGILGQLEVKIYNDGTIKQGDALTASTYQGYATKANEKAYIIGHALETPISKGFTKVLTYIRPSIYDPSLLQHTNLVYSPSVSGQDLATQPTSTTNSRNSTSGITNKNDILGAKVEDLKQRQKIASNDANSELLENRDASAIIGGSDFKDLDTNLSSSTTSPTPTPSNGKSSGTTSISAGTRFVTIYTDALTAGKVVYLTPLSKDQNISIYIKEIARCINVSNCTPHFTVASDARLKNPVSFRWELSKTSTSTQ